MHSNVEAQEIRGNVKTRLLCDSVLADDGCQDVCLSITLPVCLHWRLALLQTRFKSLGGAIASCVLLFYLADLILKIDLSVLDCASGYLCVMAHR